MSSNENICYSIFTKYLEPSVMWATLRKFGLEHHDLPTMLWNAAVFLRFLALDVDSRNTTRMPVTRYISSAIIIALYLYTYHISAYWLVFWRDGGDMVLNLVLLAITASSSIGVVKLLYLYTNGKELKKLSSGYLDLDATLTPDSRMSKNVHATLRNVKKRAIFFWTIVLGNGLIYQLIPIFTPGRHLIEDDQILLGLEPMFESPNFEIATVALFWGVFLGVYCPANITGFMIIIVGYTEAQMLALSQELIHLWDDAQTHYQQTPQDDLSIDNDSCSYAATELDIRTRKSRIINNYITHRLVSIMKIHATHIDLTNQIETVFKMAIAGEFILLSAALIMELLGGLENTWIEMPFALVQVSMDCFTGQRLVDANKVFEDAVYACQWENFDVGNRKLVLVMLQNAQKTMQLSAGGLVCLNYISLMSVFKSIYSAYTAIRSTMS